MGERLAWWLLVRACHWWGSRYLDQWDKFRFETEYGPVFVNIGRQAEYPDSFDRVTPGGKPALMRAAGGEGQDDRS